MKTDLCVPGKGVLVSLLIKMSSSSSAPARRRMDGLDRYLQRVRKCPHTELVLIRQYSHFAYFTCTKCKCQRMIQTYPHPKPQPKDVDPYDSETEMYGSEDDRY